MPNIDKQNFDIKIPRADTFEINILTEKTVKSNTGEGRNSELNNTVHKESNSGFGTLKLVHDNTLTSVGFGIENYNTDNPNIKLDFHPTPEKNLEEEADALEVNLS